MEAGTRWHLCPHQPYQLLYTPWSPKFWFCLKNDHVLRWPRWSQGYVQLAPCTAPLKPATKARIGATSTIVWVLLHTPRQAQVWYSSQLNIHHWLTDLQELQRQWFLIHIMPQYTPNTMKSDQNRSRLFKYKWFGSQSCHQIKLEIKLSSDWMKEKAV